MLDRRLTIYSVILGIVALALVTVLVLVLRKRAMVADVEERASVTRQEKKNPIRPLNSYVPERPWKQGDPPIPAPPPESIGGVGF